MTPELVESVAKIARHCWRGTHWRKTPKGPVNIKEPLKKSHLEKHCNGGPGVGCAPIVPGENVTRIALYDLDSHKGDVSWERMIEIALDLIARLNEHGIAVNPFRSSGGKGIHLLMLWDEPQDAYSIRALLTEVLAAAGFANGTKGVKHGEIEIFPKQDEVPADGFGNMFILPLCGESLPLNPETLEVEDYEYAETTDWAHSRPVEKRLKPAPPERIIDPSTATNLADVRSALQAILNEGEQSLDYDTWRNIVFAIHHASGGSDEGLALAHEFSARSPKYEPEFLDERVWPYARSERGGSVITEATIFALARKHGWDAVSSLDEFEVVTECDTPPPVGEEQPSVGRFPVLSFAAFTNRPEVLWLVEDVLPRGELVLLIGQSTAGKSFVALDLAISISRGEPWRGRYVERGRVVMIVAEGAGGFRNRCVAAAQHLCLPVESVDIGVIADTPNFLKKEDVGSVVESLKQFGRIDVLIVDTLAQVTPGGNENSAEDMGAALANCKALHRATGATVVLVHHVGKDASKGARGWSGIKAAADAEWEVSRIENQRLITITKVKDGEDGVVLPFKLAPVTIGENARGKPIISCVIEHVDQVVEKKARPAPKGTWPPRVWKVLVDGLVDLGDAGVDQEILVANVAAQTVGERREESIERAINTLAENGYVRIEGGKVYVL